MISILELEQPLVEEGLTEYNNLSGGASCTTALVLVLRRHAAHLTL